MNSSFVRIVFSILFVLVTAVQAGDAASQTVKQPEATTQPKAAAQPEATAQPKAAAQPEATAQPEAAAQPENVVQVIGKTPTKQNERPDNRLYSVQDEEINSPYLEIVEKQHKLLSTTHQQNTDNFAYLSIAMTILLGMFTVIGVFFTGAGTYAYFSTKRKIQNNIHKKFKELGSNSNELIDEKFGEREALAKKELSNLIASEFLRQTHQSRTILNLIQLIQASVYAQSGPTDAPPITNAISGLFLSKERSQALEILLDRREILQEILPIHGPLLELLDLVESDLVEPLTGTEHLELKRLKAYFSESSPHL